jgi:hypothetical protein
MKTVGFCTHFAPTDEWAFEYALNLARTQHWQLNICHWLESPFTIRRDVVYADPFEHDQIVTVTPALLNQLERRLREYYEPKLGDFTEVAFKLCEGQYQVELVRCFRQQLLDLVVMGYQPAPDTPSLGERSVEAFAAGLAYPAIVVGGNGPGTFLINQAAVDLPDQLVLPEGRWTVLEPVLAPILFR